MAASEIFRHGRRLIRVCIPRRKPYYFWLLFVCYEEIQQKRMGLLLRLPELDVAPVEGLQLKLSEFDFGLEPLLN